MSTDIRLRKSVISPTLIAGIASFLPESQNDDIVYEKTEYTFSLVHPSFRKAIMQRSRGLRVGSINLSVNANEICNIIVHPFAVIEPKFLIPDYLNISLEGKNATYHELLSTVLFLKQRCSLPPLISQLRAMYDDDINHEDDLLHDLLEEVKEHLESFEGIYVHMGVFKAVQLPRLRFLTLSEPKGLVQSLVAVIPNLTTCDLFVSQTRRRQSADFLEFFTGELLYLDGLKIDFTGQEIKDPSKIVKLSVIDCKEIEHIELQNYSSLHTLLLSQTSIDDLTGISNCTNINLLNASGCHMLKDVNCLNAFINLKALFLHQTRVTNAGILGLSGCVNLEKLNLGGCANLSDVNCLGALVFLKELHLWSTKITDQGIVELKGCYSLVELVLDDCPKITDVSSLKDLYFLQYLSLIQTSVDTKGVKELRSCPVLECLGISGTQIESPPKLWNHVSVVKYLSAL